MFSLVLKDWILQRRSFAGILLLICSLDIIAGLLAADIVTRLVIISTPMMVLTAILAVMQSNSFKSEWQQNTHFLLLALPIRPATLAFGKYLAFLSFGLLVLAVFPIGLNFATPDPGQISTTLPGTPRSILLQLVGFYYLSLLQLFLGISIFLQGCLVGRQRFRGLLSLTLFAGCILAVMILAVPATSTMSGLGYHEIDLQSARSSITELVFYPAFFIYAAGVGTLFLGIGLWLFDRRIDL